MNLLDLVMEIVINLIFDTKYHMFFYFSFAHNNINPSPHDTLFL